MIKIESSEFHKIKNDFKITPFSVYMSPKTREKSTFSIYKKTSKGYLIPRFYNTNLYKAQEANKFDRTNPVFHGTLRDSQKQFVSRVHKNLINKNGCILSVPPGFGKTIMSIYMSCKLKLKTLVIVHKTFLLNQWMESLNKFSDHKVGIIQGKKIDIEDKTIVIAMLQSISMKDYPKEIYNAFDFIIVDEVHHIATKSFSKALLKFNFTFSLGLSATPTRKDGLTKVYQYFLGNSVVSENDISSIKKCLQERKKEVVVYRHQYHSKKNDKLFQSIPLYYKSEQFNISKMITNISQSECRNKFIYEIIKKNVNNRYALILSSRITQLEELHNRFKKDYPRIKSSLFIGKICLKKLQQSLQNNVQVIFGTYEFISEGFDYPALNTLFLLTPRSDIVQICGRILRKIGNSPIIHDIWDNIVPFNYQATKRLNYYKKSKFDVI